MVDLIINRVSAGVDNFCSQSQPVVEQLLAIQKSMPDIEASAVVSVDDLVLALILPPDFEEDHVAQCQLHI